MKTTTSKLQTFVNGSLRQILNIRWPEVMSNEELWRSTGEIEMSTQITRRKWNWIGHTLKKGHEAIEREALDWNPQGKRRSGRPRHPWRRTENSEALEEGEVKKMAANGTRWPQIGQDGGVLLTPYVP